MRAGDLRRQVLLQRRSTIQDGFGQRSTSWVDVATTYAEITPLSGRELELAQAIKAEVNHQITIRYRPNIDSSMRAVYQGKYYNIHAVIDVEMRHKTLELSCSEGLNDGE